MRLGFLLIIVLGASSIGFAQKPMPEMNRVGVDMNRQRPLSLRDALSLALENNKDIEVARENVRIAEFDLLGAKGAYDPRLTTQAFYERIESPISSFLSGGQNGSTIQSDYTGTARLEGQSPFLGGNYRFRALLDRRGLIRGDRPRPRRARRAGARGRDRPARPSSGKSPGWRD